MSGIAGSFIPWVGSKMRLIPYILLVLPEKPIQYLEPFGGSGAVLLSLPPNAGRLDIYNDLDSELVNLFLCVKEKSNVLMREMGFLPIHSRREFEFYRDFVSHKDITLSNIYEELACLEDRSCFTEEQAEELRPIFQERLELYDIYRASAFARRAKGSFSATLNSFGVKAVDMVRFLCLFPEAAERLRNVVVENKDALLLIRERDRPGGVIYCDPPYRNAESMYRVSPKERRRLLHFHVRLWQVLSACRGWVVLSYNDCPDIRRLYRNFYILAFRRSNPMAQKKGAEYGELLITNYDPRPNMAKQLTLFDIQMKGIEMELVNIPA